MVLTRLTTLATDSTLIWAKDDYHVARATVHMRVVMGDGTTVNVFSCHLPALGNAQAARVTYANAFKAWAQSFGSPRLVGGDFNDSPGTSPINAMTTEYADAWKIKGSGTGLTHYHGTALSTRIDYWFSDLAGSAAVTDISIVGTSADSDHRAVVATYTAAPLVTETTLMNDTFSNFVPASWPFGAFTSGQDMGIPVVVNGQVNIGPLKDATTGSHYRGISTDLQDVTNNGSAYVQLVQAPNTATLAYAMFAGGTDGNNFYRWYESGNALVVEKKIAGVKKTLVNRPYDAVAHQFLRIRREYNTATGTNDVVFETAPNSNGVPGTWTVQYRETWDAHVVPSAMRFELKGGTSDAVVGAGTVVWDNFHVASDCK
jgi:hypothetical protein